MLAKGTSVRHFSLAAQEHGVISRGISRVPADMWVKGAVLII